MKKIILITLVSTVLFCVQPELALSRISLPPGFAIAVFAQDILLARQLAVGPNGTVFVGTRGDKVYALVDKNNDFRADEVITVARGLNAPNGVAFYKGSLYIAEINRVSRIDFGDKPVYANAPMKTVNDSFPRDTHHGYKYIKVGPDGKLYIPQGSPCNVCLPKDERYGTIMRMNLDGSGLEVFARGIRNSVGFAFHPVTGELWFTDNGRDLLGDNIPPDELNHARVAGLHFGFPFLHGNRVRDPEFGASLPAAGITTPVQELGPHVASLGMTFYTGTQFPAEYRNAIFIAEHGSWNRSIPIGYRVTTVRLSGDSSSGYGAFGQGWMNPTGGRANAWGRPVDVAVYADGSLLVSDDAAGAVYRISYGG